MIISLRFQSILTNERLVAVIRENTYEQAKFVINQAIKNGIKIIEITLTTPDALDLIYYFETLNKEAILGLLIGAGTVLTKEDAIKSVEKGAKFLVSPHFSEEVSRVSVEKNVVYIPGVFTPAEALLAYNKGHKVLKLFPSNVLGSAFVASLKKPYPFLEFMPSGGVNLSNINDWLSAGCIAVSVGGDFISGKNDQEISENISKYRGVIHDFKRKK